MHSTAQLKSWTIQQAHTDALWLQHEGTGNNLKLQSVRINDPGHVRYWFTFLLPGGEYLVVVTHEDSILKKIERETDIGDSEWVLADVARRSSPGPEAECTGKVFTDTICEYPLIAYYDEEGARYPTSFTGRSLKVPCSQPFWLLASPYSAWITTPKRFLCKRRFDLAPTANRGITG